MPFLHILKPSFGIEDKIKGRYRLINFKRLSRDWLIAFVPIVSVLLMVFIFLIYPNEKLELSYLDEVDALYRDLNASTFRFGVTMSLISGTALAFVCAISYNAFKLRYAMPTKVPAKLISKYIRNQSAPHSAIVSTRFELNFELENKEIKFFFVSPEQFSLVFENNKGILTYKEHSKSVYIDFEVLEING